jgi:hypothetical protein
VAQPTSLFRRKTAGADILIDNEKKGFKDMMNTIALIYSKPEPTQDTLRVWWAKLNQYEFMQVSQAFDSWVDKNKYMPNIADILETIKMQQPKEFIKMLPRNPTPYEIEHNKQKANELLSKIELKPTDPKAWAHKIIDLHSQGKYKLEIGVKFAREALKNKFNERILNDA